MTDPMTLQHRIDGPQDGPVLVLGPALGTTWHMWDRQVLELTSHWRVVRYDLPGHGGAPAEPATLVADLTGRLLFALDDLGVERFSYAGCSLGGAVGMDLALRYPDRVASLVLVSASARFGTSDAWRQRGVVVRSGGLEQVARTAPDRWFTPTFRSAQASIMEWAVQMVRTTDAECYAAACEAMAGFDVRAELGRITVPTLVVAGAEDAEAPPADARVLVAGIPDARLAVVPGAAHLVPVEQARACTGLLVQHGADSGSDRAAPTAGGPPRQRLPIEVPALPPPAALADPYAAGLTVRREVLGDAHVDQETADADDFTRDFQDFLTRYAWGGVWTRPELDRKARSCITLAVLVAGGHMDELALHIRAALRNGLSPAEIREVLLHTAVYCGISAVTSAFAVAQRVIREETRLPG